MSIFWNNVLKMREKGRQLVPKPTPKPEAVEKPKTKAKKATVVIKNDEGTSTES